MAPRRSSTIAEQLSDAVLAMLPGNAQFRPVANVLSELAGPGQRVGMEQDHEEPYVPPGSDWAGYVSGQILDPQTKAMPYFETPGPAQGSVPGTPIQLQRPPGTPTLSWEQQVARFGLGRPDPGNVSEIPPMALAPPGATANAPSQRPPWPATPQPSQDDMNAAILDYLRQQQGQQPDNSGGYGDYAGAY